MRLPSQRTSAGSRRRAAAVGDEVDPGLGQHRPQPGEAADGDGVVAQVGHPAGGDDEDPRARVAGRGRRARAPGGQVGRRASASGVAHSTPVVGCTATAAMPSMASGPSRRPVGSVVRATRPAPIRGSATVRWNGPGEHPVAPDERRHEGEELAGLDQPPDHGPVVDVLEEGVGRPAAEGPHRGDVEDGHGVDVVRLEEGRGRGLVGDRPPGPVRADLHHGAVGRGRRRSSGRPGTARPRRPGGRGCRRRG